MCQCFSKQRWHSQAWRLKCLKGCKIERSSWNLDWYTILCLPRGLERQTLRFSFRHLVIRLCTLWNDYFKSTVYSNINVTALLKGSERILSPNFKRLFKRFSFCYCYSFIGYSKELTKLWTNSSHAFSWRTLNRWINLRNFNESTQHN